MASVVQVLDSIADTFVAELNNEQTSLNNLLYTKEISTSLHVTEQDREEFYRFKPSSHIPGIGKLILEYMERNVPKDKLGSILLVLKSLSTSLGTMVISGGIGFRPFYELPLAKREKVLNALQHSKFADLRLLFRVFRLITLIHSYGTVDSNGDNKAWNALKYDGPNRELQKNSQSAQKVWRPEFLDLKESDVYEYDVVVVGSGAGGGVMAAELSKAGHKVILLEKGSYCHPSELSLVEYNSLAGFYEREAGYYSEDGGIFVLAGRTWGGGTFVNWCASLELPAIVRQEWDSVFGLEHFSSPAFQESFDVVSEKIGVSQPLKFNNSNQLFLDGCNKLGYQVSAIPQNTAGKEHECGHCTFGCPSGTKQSSSITFIHDAAKNGCHFACEINVDKVLHQNGKATGVLATKNGRKITIKSKKVVLSCGSMNTPVVLQNSNISNLSPHVGQNLRMHPVSLIFGVFPDRDILPYKGGIMTTICNQVADLDQLWYGARLEVPASQPSLYIGTQAWKSASDHKQKFLNWPHTVSLIALTRDKDSVGRIFVDREHKGRLDWKLGKHDAKSLLAAFEVGLAALVAAGAKKVFTAQIDVDPFDVTQSPEDTLKSKEWKDYLEKIKQAGIDPTKITVFSAHQMGSCRMSSKREYGVVKPTGESWDIDGLYISDASVFPTASGVK
ncbi:hypothetical protein HK103_000265 [Boothiomyces macroporosus]|uniref:Long-chain-alcohol oxidase n=1 Tax=Boothiomyces macroporosus TaxID=261099 RepID=A0AAD5Y603_9FUNG|nr:hypothetical protein HK103_000265 [Boothiomyces macroporosus]